MAMIWVVLALISRVIPVFQASKSRFDRGYEALMHRVLMFYLKSIPIGAAGVTMEAGKRKVFR